MNDDLLFDIKDDIGLVTFNRPKTRNAFTFAMYDRLAEIASEIIAAHAKGENTLKALILTGAGDKAFAAGTDISNFRGFASDEDALGYERQMDHVLGTFEQIPIPVIAAIRGACTGGGAAVAACCDLRVASSDLKYGFPIARTLGNCLSNQNLSRQIQLLGAARAKEIIFTARLIEADEALQIALISELVDDPLARAQELAEQLKGHAPLTLEASKEALRRLREDSANVDSDDLIVKCYNSEDFHEGLEAFLEKRKPNWKGK